MKKVFSGDVRETLNSMKKYFTELGARQGDEALVQTMGSGKASVLVCRGRVTLDVAVEWDHHAAGILAAKALQQLGVQTKMVL